MQLGTGTVKEVYQALQSSTQSNHDIFQQMCSRSHDEFAEYVSDADQNIQEKDLIDFIETSTNHAKKTDAYLRLIKTAELDVLKRLISKTGVMSAVEYTTATQFDAMLAACRYGREDVLRWLTDDLQFTIDTKTRRKMIMHAALTAGQIDLLRVLTKPVTEGGFGFKFYLKKLDSSHHPVMLAIKQGNLALLRELVKPTSEGGFGLSLDVRDELDYGPAMQAALAGELFLFQKLTQPVSEGGFGVPASRHTELRNFPYDVREKYPGKHAYLMTIQHSRIAPTKAETLNVIDMENATNEVYKLSKHLGGGSYGDVFEFNGKEKKFAVKVPTDTWKVCEPDRMSHEFLSVRKEFYMMCKAYPDEGPYALQSMRKIEGGEYFASWRMMMPFIPGRHISQVLKDVRDPLLGAKIILESMKAVELIHGNGVLHGDLRPGNILIDIKGGIVNAHLIDFGFSCSLGKPAEQLWWDSNKFFPPERIGREIEAHTSQDIWSLARTFEWSLASSMLRKLPEFPTVNKFISNGLEVYPVLRQPLSVFINMLKADIAEYENTIAQDNRIMEKSPNHRYVAGNRFFVEDQSKKLNSVEKLNAVVRRV